MDDAWPIIILAAAFGCYVVKLAVDELRYRLAVWRGERLEPWQRRAMMEHGEDRRQGFPIR